MKKNAFPPESTERSQRQSVTLDLLPDSLESFNPLLSLFTRLYFFADYKYLDRHPCP